MGFWALAAQGRRASVRCGFKSCAGGLGDWIVEGKCEENANFALSEQTGDFYGIRVY